MKLRPRNAVTGKPLNSIQGNLSPKITIADHFSTLEAPRIERTKRHKLIDGQFFRQLFVKIQKQDILA